MKVYSGHKDEAQMERVLGEACFGLNNYQAAIAPLERYQGAVSRPQRKALYELGPLSAERCHDRLETHEAQL